MRTYEEEKKALSVDVAIAKKLVLLQDNPDFQEVFIKHYLEDYAITQIHNIGYKTAEQINGFISQTMARGIFVKFMDGIIFEGNEAQQKLKDLTEPDLNEESDPMD